MVTTRSKGNSADQDSREPGGAKTGQKRSRVQAPKAQSDGTKTKQRKKDRDEPQHEKNERGEVHDVAVMPSKPQNESTKPAHTKVERLLKQYPGLPLSDTDLEEPGKATPETVLALLLNAILSSTRVSHTIAAKTTDLVIKAGYHKLDVLKKSTWQDRTEVLTEGGYTHYREKTATFLGELAELIEEKYQGDLNAILKSTSEDPKKIRAELKTIKGLGDVGIDIFFTTAQHVWPCLAPWIDPRSLKTAENIGLGKDVQALWKEVGEKPEVMCNLAGALTDVRLEKKESEWA
ncbi:hypothetical protein H2200_001895 [Cladophialophora chaetospira]|uniref:HhH-GPD domain-containing protein n=1 Tax=Cladophialophora chaetospira TaxID=386627 RepID=A0AA39CNF7_9EURO|nr:hypothetical protein H2200_001895 [Cladophialophora chaetospira]